VPDVLILASDILAVLILGSVGTWGLKYWTHMLSDKDLTNLRYIWVPSMISGAFFFVLVLGLLINDVFGTYLNTPFYLSIHPFLLVGSGFFALSTYRFMKTIKSHEESKKKAEISLSKLRDEISKREQG
jgi:hypothetical protein